MRILFVCTANICRSVMAEALLKCQLAGQGKRIVVNSAGIEVIPGLTPDSNAREICSSHGLDIGSHKPHQLTLEMLEESDAILCLTDNHRQRIVGAYPRYEAKVFLLKEFRRHGHVKHLSIEDPTGHSLRRYKKCFHEIEAEVKRIAPLLIQEGA
jgi:protein-tyrosine phosphatase